MARCLTIVLLLAACVHGAIVRDVRDALNRKGWAAAESLVRQFRAKHGNTPEALEAFSWFARAALAEKRYAEAEKYAADTMRQAEAMLTKYKADDANLAIAIGAAIEVQAHVLAAGGERDQAVDYLRSQLRRFRSSAVIATRTQKNLHLLSLEGKPAPPLEGVPLAAYKGKPALIFLWAHWCSDCKQQGPVIARLREEMKDLAIIAPTRLYGYAERGRDVGPAEERAYIAKVYAETYGRLKGVPAPVSESNFRNYGVSTTPTIVLVDRAGIVRLYHPGRMTYEELAPKVREAAAAAK